MATRSMIALKQTGTNGTDYYTSIYCHWDGYPEAMLPTLTSSFANVERIKELLALGDLSALYPSIEKPEGHTFSSPVKGHTVAYGRDRGDKGTQARKYYTYYELKRSAQKANCEFLYVFNNEESKWEYFEI